jgi:DNA-binding MarR family transcriptional regulator
MWLSDDEQRLWRTYLAMSSGLQLSMNRQLQAECGLSLADYEVLVALEELDGRGRGEPSGPCRVNELGDHLGWEQSRLSHQLRRMRVRGLISRHGADDDRRGATVELTAAGSSALASAAPGHAELVRSLVFDGMGAADLRAVQRWATGVLNRLRPD